VTGDPKTNPRECGECGRNGADFPTCPREECPARDQQTNADLCDCAEDTSCSGACLTAAGIARNIRLTLPVMGLHPDNQAWINQEVERLVEMANAQRS